MKKITVLTTALLLCGPMMAQTNSTYDAQFIDWPTYSGDDLELNVDSKGTAFRMTDAKEIARNLKFDKIDFQRRGPRPGSEAAQRQMAGSGPRRQNLP